MRGLPADVRRELAEALASPVRGGYATVASAASRGFETLSSVRAFVAPLLELAVAEAPGLVETDGAVIDAIHGTHGVQATAPVERIAESIAFAVTRRISRESHHSALLFDRLARFLLDVCRSCPSLRDGVVIVVPDLEWWDRPSVRLLYRLSRLAGADDRLALVTLAPNWRIRQPRAQTRVAWARATFLQHLCSLPTVHVVAAGGPTPLGLTTKRLAMETTDSALAEIGAALAYQNYERVYLLCDELLARADDAGATAEAHRLLGITHAQLGDYGTAIAEFARAEHLADDPRLQAHLCYLSGLVSTKRTYDLDRAKRHYARGVRRLAGLDAADSRVRLERAWLLNGQALVATLEAKTADADGRERLFGDAFRLELEAYDLARQLRTPAGSYLRHNLLANITFLLEIARRYREALDFWSRAFERYLASDSAGFNTMYDYRLAILLFRLGRNGEALSALERVRGFCREQHDPFTEERVYLAEAHLAFTTGAFRRALASHVEGARLALRLRDRDAYCLHAAGLLWSVARIGDDDLFAAAADAVRGAIDVATDKDPVRALEDAGIAPPVPSPKVSPYVPSVDLEGSPEKDLNRYLVAAGGPLVAETR